MQRKKLRVVRVGLSAGRKRMKVLIPFPWNLNVRLVAWNPVEKARKAQGALSGRNLFRAQKSCASHPARENQRLIIESNRRWIRQTYLRSHQTARCTDESKGVWWMLPMTLTTQGWSRRLLSHRALSRRLLKSAALPPTTSASCFNSLRSRHQEALCTRLQIARAGSN